MKVLLKLFRKLSASRLLALFFLAFILYVGIGELPRFLENTGLIFQDTMSFDAYVDMVDSEYHSMLTTGTNLPLLHNKGTYINFNGMMAKVLGQPMMNQRLKLTNGHLSFLPQSLRSREQLEATAANIASLCQSQTDNGNYFLFVLSPSQISNNENLLPFGYTDYTNENADSLLAFLRERGVTCLDLRESMIADGLDHSEAFYITDHHWTSQTGFWAYTKILEKLNQMGAIGNLDPFFTDPSNFDFLIYEDTFLGSSGKRTGVYYAGVDDICRIVPKFDTDISISIESINIHKKGKYENVAYGEWGKFPPENVDLFTYNFYGLFGWGDRPLTRWRNENAPHSGKILLIGESFGNVPFSLMSLYIESCDEMDMRHFNGSFEDYYESYSPDTVILNVNVDQIVSDNTTHPYFPD